MMCFIELSIAKVRRISRTNGNADIRRLFEGPLIKFPSYETALSLKQLISLSIALKDEKRSLFL